MINALKLFFVTLITLAVSFNTVSAQDYKPVEVDLGIKYNFLLGNYTGGGVGVFVEPQYNINNKFSAGLKLGFDVLGGTPKDSEAEVKVSVLPSYILTGDYFLVNSGNKRVFAGLGLGFSGQGSLELEDAPGIPVTEIGTVFGIVPRIGAKLGLFKVALDYSIYTNENARSFLGLNLALSLGGRQK